MPASDVVKPTQTTKPSSYIPCLDGFRAVAFLCVALAHTSGPTIGRFFPAKLGVTIFFFLSGYLITTLLRREWQDTGKVALKDFYIRRALRIFIPMYIAYAFSTVLALLLGMNPGSWGGVASVFFYAYNYMRVLHAPALPPGLDLTWSLSVEEHFYLLFPLFFIFLMRRRIGPATRARILLLLCVIGLLWRTYVMFHHFPKEWTYYATDCRFDSILWGSLLAMWNNPVFDKPSPVFKQYGGWLAAIGFFGIVAMMFIGSDTFRETARYTIQAICMYAIFFFSISNSTHWSVSWLENRAVRYLGWLSYSLYLIHRAIVEIVKTHVTTNAWVVCLLTLFLSFLYAVAIRHLVELPIQRYRARYRHTAPPISTAVPVEGI